MHVMFVCTGNICRSPMGELLLARYFKETSITVSSAGTRGLPHHEIDPSSARLMAAAGIDSSAFRSRRLTQPLAASADLILCFEKKHRTDIVTVNPTAVSRTFLLNEFAAMSTYAAQHRLVRGLTVEQRLRSIIAAAPSIRPRLAEEAAATRATPSAQPTTQPSAQAQPADNAEIADPYGRDFSAFQVAADQTNQALYEIVHSLKK
jgi:protein-tyrosine phosphatase